MLTEPMALGAFKLNPKNAPPRVYIYIYIYVYIERDIYMKICTHALVHIFIFICIYMVLGAF